MHPKQAIETIKESFREHHDVLGDTREKKLDELDIAVYANLELRNTPLHFGVLMWGSGVLEGKT